ncbi:putative phycocyanin operon protein w [Quercus suber]|uniref:Phycocyanin operon protein w n=1 Tax=Quercus suber TaxID=58331 RepID=A0AAW0JUP3_QUESU
MALCAPTHNLSLSSVKSHARRRPRSRKGYGTGMVAMAASYEYEEGQLERPKWAGQTPLSRLELERIQNPSLVYPDYYLNPFHAYDEGNLSWLAAAEAEAATMSMARRAIPDASSLDEANEIIRGNWLQAIEQHHLQYSGNSTIRDILDVGCSVGVSTGYLADKFPSAKVTGLDLSPYFLAVAQFKEKKDPQERIQ